MSSQKPFIAKLMNDLLLGQYVYASKFSQIYLICYSYYNKNKFIQIFLKKYLV